jgi:hypothetical protein
LEVDYAESKAARTRYCDGKSQSSAALRREGSSRTYREYDQSTSCAGLWSKRPVRAPPNIKYHNTTGVGAANPVADFPK